MDYGTIIYPNIITDPIDAVVLEVYDDPADVRDHAYDYTLDQIKKLFFAGKLNFTFEDPHTVGADVVVFKPISMDANMPIGSYPDDGYPQDVQYIVFTVRYNDSEYNVWTYEMEPGKVGLSYFDV